MESPTIGVPELIPEHRAALLALARATLEAQVRGGPLPSVPDMPGARRCRGGFVTLEAQGALRGCIGHIPADRSLGEVVRDMTVAAAHDDPRFAPVTEAELAGIRIEISVLTEPCRLAPVDTKRIRIGRDGLCVRRGRAVGLLLPQVAPGQGWDPDAFLTATCRKAGLSADAWREPDTEVFTFQADVFGE